MSHVVLNPADERQFQWKYFGMFLALMIDLKDQIRLEFHQRGTRCDGQDSMMSRRLDEHAGFPTGLLETDGGVARGKLQDGGKPRRQKQHARPARRVVAKDGRKLRGTFIVP